MSTYEDDLQRYKRLYEEEYQIVAKCWEALGISTYEGANGRSIYELIAECRAKADRSGEAEQREPTLADLERQLKQAEFEKQAYTDALRYRWLRGMIFDDRIIVASDRMLHGDKLDAAIDAAMSAQSDTGESK